MNGYMKVTINKKDYGVKFTMWAIEKMDELNAQHTTSIQKTTNMIYAGLLNNCRHNKTELNLTYEEVELWVDTLFDTEEGRNLIMSIDKCLEQCGSYQFVLEQAEEAKKKLNGTPSTASHSVS